MTLDLSRLARAAWRLWSADRPLLLPLSGLFLFVPQYAVLLLVPAVPRMPEGAQGTAAMTAWTEAVGQWMGSYGLLYFAATVAALYGQLAIGCWYLGPAAGQGGAAMRRALTLLPRLLLATLAVSAPLGVGGFALAGLGTAGLVIAMGPILYVLARTLLMTPVLAAEPGTPALRAVARSWALTRGTGLSLVGLLAAVMLPAQLLSAALGAAAQGLAENGGNNPVVVALVNAGAAGAAWASGLALALAGVSAYRTLSR